VSDNGSKVTLNQSAVSALDTIHELAHSPASDPSIGNQMEDQTRLQFEAGRAAFELNYPYVYPSAKADVPDIFKNMAWTTYPTVKPGEPPHVTIGGIDLAVSAFSNHKQQAFDAIEQWERDGDGGYIRPRIHMMRAQAQAHMFDFDSSDSTNVAVNHNRQLRKAGECVCKFAARVDAKIQASCDRQEAEHQTKRPLLGHLEWAERHAALMLDIMSTAAVYGGIKCVQN
jgi:hypothetical protein